MPVLPTPFLPLAIAIAWMGGQFLLHSLPIARIGSVTVTSLSTLALEYYHQHRAIIFPLKADAKPLWGRTQPSFNVYF
ncbi:hypothetical protein D3C85_1618370 [compost metagenome]